MLPKKNKNKPTGKDQQQKQNHSMQRTDPNAEIIKAHKQADADMEQDADLSIHSPNDDLDEGETARLGEDKTDLV